MRRVDALLFDKDGTLFDFNATWVSFTETMLPQWSDGDAGVEARLAAALGFDPVARAFDPSSVVFADTPLEVAAAVGAVLGQPAEALVDRLNAEAAQAPMHEAVPLKPLLARFRAEGLVIGLATNDAEAPARAHLESVGVLEMFDFIAGSDSGYGAKPAPGMVQAFLGATGVSAKRVAMVGDSTHDLKAGGAAGTQRVAVLTGLASEVDLAPFADVVLDDIGGLPDWIEM